MPTSGQDTLRDRITSWESEP